MSAVEGGLSKRYTPPGTVLLENKAVCLNPRLLHAAKADGGNPQPGVHGIRSNISSHSR